MRVYHVAIEFTSSLPEVAHDLQELLDSRDVCGATEAIFHQLLDQIEEEI